MVEEAKMLQLWQEGYGVVEHLDVDEDKRTMVLYFSQENIIMLPFLPDLEKKIRKRIGHKIGLLRTDIEETPYLLMEGD